MKAVFITGTDTGVGKTFVCNMLLNLFKSSGINAVTQKWVQTGCSSFKNSDLKNRGQRVIPDCDLRMPYLFKFPGSPHLAAKLENKKISKSKIIKAFKALEKKYDFVIVEGAGGALVPIDEKSFLIDIAQELKLPVLLVAQNKLGSINHTLLTIEALKKRRINLLGVIFNNPKKENKQILKDNPKIVAKFGRVKIFGVLPWIKNG